MDDAESVFRSCASKVRVRADRQRIEGAAGLIAREAEAYARAAEGGILHSIPTHPSVSGIVSTTEMTSLYTNHLASRRGVARATYDRLLVLPRNGTCPLCAVRTVSTLDHYLPKSTHPAYAVTPINLVACCSDCNFLKDEHRPSGPADQFIHPYFDNVEADQWLHAQVLETSPPAVVFSVQGPSCWDRQLEERVQFQFGTLQLSKVYASRSAEELSSIMYGLRELHARAGLEGVRADLQGRHASCRADAANGWNTALYEALSRSDWYCDRGFEF
jgi:hypothetical protein